MGDTSGHRFLGKISLGWLWSRITTLLEDKSDKKNQFIANGSSTLPTKTIQIDTPSGPSSATFIMDTAVDNAFGAANEDSAIPTCSNVVNYVAGAIQTAQVGATTFHGTLTSPSQLSNLTSYKAGWYWAVGTAGTYAGKVCEAGDFVFCISDYSLLYNENDFSVVQNNIDITNFTAKRTASIPFGKVDSTSTATVFTATVAGITKLEDGVCCYLTNDVVTSASGFTLNINGLGAKPVYTNLADATRDTTIFNKAYTMLFVYNSTRVSGGCWDCYRGYDSNTNTIGYQLRTNNGILKTTDAFRYYKVLFTSADNTHWVPSSVDSTNNATSAKAVNQRPINPFGPIVYCHSTSAFAANADVTATAIWQQYAITLGYSFNRTGAALALTTKAPVYIKCTPQSDGSAIIDADTPYVQTLPSTEDGKIYIYFGIAYSATAVELRMEHPVFYYKGGAIRVWVNQAQAVGKVELEKYNSDATESSEGTPANGQTDVKVDNVSIGTVVTSYAPGTAQRPYVAPSWYALNTKLSGKQDTISDLNEIRSGASKGSTAIQPTDIRDELDPGGNGEIADSAAIAAYIEGKAPTKPTTSTDNAIARYDGTSGNLQNSGVTINDSNHVSAAKFITSGGNANQVVLGNGNLANASELTQYEAYLAWGGKNFAGNYGPIDAALVAELGAPRTMFAKAAGIVVAYSTDGGETWLDYEATDDAKVGLFSSGRNFYIGKSSTAGGSSTDYMLRVTLHTSAAGIYTVLNKFIIFVGTNGSTGCYCTIRCRTQQNYENNVDTWVTRADQVPITGWTGYNVINIVGTATYGNTKGSQYGEWQFIFGCTGYSGSSSGLYIYKIFGYGGVGWATPSTMAKTGHIYAFDASQNATFPAQVQATSFKKTGGTSSQFLKADGSVDNNTYLTAQDISGKADKSAQSVTSVSNNETYNIVEGKKVTIATNGGTSDVDVVQLGSVKGAPSATSSAAAKEIPTWQGVKEYVQTNSPAPTAGDGISISGSTISLKTASTSEVGGIKSVSVDVEPNIYKVTVDASEQTAEVPIPNASANKTGVLTKEDFATFSGKQDALTFDPAPTINSTRPVTSGGVYEALEQKADKTSTYTKTEVNNLVSTIHNDVIIGALPSTGVANKIYRVPGTNSYADYAWDGTQFVKLAEFEGSIFVQLTEAQYDALSDTEKNNGTWYFIEEE